MDANKSTLQFTKATIKTSGGQTVFAGPGTDFVSVGSVSYNEVVWVYWKEDGYYYIEYQVDGTYTYKSGYVPMSAFNGIVTNRTIPASNAGTRYVNKNSTTYFGYSTNFVASGSVSRGESVVYMGVKVEGYAFIQYAVTGAYNMYKRAWIVANNLSTTPPTK